MEVTRVAVPSGAKIGTGTTNAYLLGRSPALLVDPAARTDRLYEYIDDRTVTHIVVTHTHPDHVGGVAEYARRTDATVWARYGRVERFRAATGCDPDRVLGPGTTISLGGETVTVLDAPGHTVDHVAFRAGTAGPIICGDCVVDEGSVAVTAPMGDMRSYLTTLRRLWATDPPWLGPGHGPVIDEPRRVCERLLDHRRDRERRVLAAVRDGARTLESLCERSYEKDLAGVRTLARGTVRAHLEKLAGEGRVEWDGERARPVGEAGETV